ncbi:MAG: zinc-ribbon domain-containing protein [Fimbriimonadaceae bacterium]
MTCPRCAKKNEEDARFCAKCGLNLIEAKQNLEPKPIEETLYCYRHPKETTNLSCGRCDKPVCTNCVVIGPAGPRCPDCAKSQKVFRPAAMGLTAKRTAQSLGKQGPWSWYYVILIVVMLGGFIRSCTPIFNQPQSQLQYEEQLPDQEK